MVEKLFFSEKITNKAEWNPGWISRDFNCCSALVRPRGSWDEAASKIFLSASILLLVFENHHGDLTNFLRKKNYAMNFTWLLHELQLFIFSVIFCLATRVSQFVVRNLFWFWSELVFENLSRTKENHIHNQKSTKFYSNFMINDMKYLIF